VSKSSNPLKAVHEIVEDVIGLSEGKRGMRREA
jgi:hypothetical protein